MYELNVKGTLTAKQAAHVPVIRKWKLVWERREFGTRVEKIDRTFPLKIVNWHEIPVGGIEIKLGSDFEFKLDKVAPTNSGAYPLAVKLLYRGTVVPGTFKVFSIPGYGEKKLLSFNTQVWKGAKVDVEATLLFAP